jgi:hypothetical protein
MSFGCAYESAYREYATAQATMATAAGPLVTLHPDGRLASLGNPMIPMAMMQMKAPKSEWESLVEWMKFATPFAAIWGIVGSIGGGGTTTNVNGQGNYTGNAMGNQGLMGSPTTTTTTVTEVVQPVVE